MQLHHALGSLASLTASSASTLLAQQQRYEIEVSQLSLQANALVRKLVDGGSVAVERPDYVYDSAAGMAATKVQKLSSSIGKGQVNVGMPLLEAELIKENKILKSDVKFLQRRVSSDLIHVYLHLFASRARTDATCASSLSSSKIQRTNSTNSNPSCSVSEHISSPVHLSSPSTPSLT